jgi:hypothetical protein
MAPESYLLGTARVPRACFDVDSLGVVVLIDFAPLIAMFAGISPTSLEAT